MFNCLHKTNKCLANAKRSCGCSVLCLCPKSSLCSCPHYGRIVTARRYASAVLAVIVCPSVCPSVRLSVTSRSCTKTAKPRISLTTPYDSPETLVFRCQKSWRNSNDITPNGGAKERWDRFLAALCGQYLAISQKRCKIGTQLL